MPWKLTSMSQHLNPVFLLFIQLFTIAFTIGFTTSSSIIRFISLPIVVISCSIVVQNLNFYISGPPTALTLNFVIAFVFQYIEVGLLSKWDISHNGPTERTEYSRNPVNGKINGENSKFVSESKKGIFNRLLFGVKTLSSFRDTNTPYEAKGVPNFSTSNPQYFPSRGKFLIQAALKLCACILTCKFVLPWAQNKPLESFAFLPNPFTITIQETTDRIWGSVLWWANIYCQLSVGYYGLAAVSVGSGIDTPSEWKPFMGDFSNAYTIRLFWG